MAQQVVKLRSNTFKYTVAVPIDGHIKIAHIEADNVVDALAGALVDLDIAEPIQVSILRNEDNG